MVLTDDDAWNYTSADGGVIADAGACRVALSDWLCAPFGHALHISPECVGLRGCTIDAWDRGLMRLVYTTAVLCTVSALQDWLLASGRCMLFADPVFFSADAA
jgi:hypothetical protein